MFLENARSAATRWKNSRSINSPYCTLESTQNAPFKAIHQDVTSGEVVIAFSIPTWGSGVNSARNHSFNRGSFHSQICKIKSAVNTSNDRIVNLLISSAMMKGEFCFDGVIRGSNSLWMWLALSARNLNSNLHDVNPVASSTFWFS